MKILVVDDNPTFLKQMQKYLSMKNYDVDMARGGRVAMKMMDKKEYDLVIVDLKMPDLPGIELMKWAKGGGTNADFLVVTGYGEVGSAVEAMKMGALDYIQKPFDMEDLMKVIKDAEKKGKSARTFLSDVVKKNLYEKSLMIISASPETLEKRYGVKASKKINFMEDEIKMEKLIEMSNTFANENTMIVLSDLEIFLKKYGMENTKKYLKFLEKITKKTKIVLFYESIEEILLVNEIMKGKSLHLMDDVVAAYKHPMRKRIINLLNKSPLSYTEIMKKLGISESSKMAFHLNKLISLKFVEKRGKKYALSIRGKKILEVIAFIMEMEEREGIIYCNVKSI